MLVNPQYVELHVICQGYLHPFLYKKCRLFKNNISINTVFTIISVAFLEALF